MSAVEGKTLEYNTTPVAFAVPELFEFLEANQFGYAIRLKANQAIERQIAHFLKRPPKENSNNIQRHFARFTYLSGINA